MSLVQRDHALLLSFRRSNLLLDQKYIAGVYLIFAVAAVLLIQLILPPFAAPDEFAHFFHADTLSSGHILPGPGSDRMIGGGVHAPALELLKLLGPTAGNGGPIPADAIAQANRIFWGGPIVFAGYPNTGQYGSGLYLPQAIGLVIGRHTGISILKSYYFARLLTALTSVGIAAIAIACAGRGAFVLAVALTTPMFLFVATSLSQDGLLVSVSALMAALVSRPQSRPSPASNWIAFFCALLIGMARPPYALLSPLLVRGRNNRPLSDWFSAPDGPLAPIVVCLLTICWLAAVGALHQPDFAADHRVSSPAQLAGLINHPGSVFTVIQGTFVAHSEFWYKSREAIGRINVPLPDWIYFTGEIAILLALSTCFFEPTTRSFLHRIVTLLVCTLSMAAVYVALYLTWTPVGQNFVEGTQGRYFLPYLVCLPLIIPPLIPVRWSDRSVIALPTQALGWVAGVAGWGMMVVVTLNALTILSRTYAAAY